MTEVGDIDVLLLCGGLGTRLRSVIGEKQKVVADIGGKPFLAFQLQRLYDQGVRHVVLAAGFGAQEVLKVSQDNNPGLMITASIEGKPLGTGGAIKLARDKARGKKWIIMNGDCLSDVSFSDLLRFHDGKDALVTLTVAKRDDAQDYGTVDVADDGKILAFREKEAEKTTGLVSVGVYCFEHDAFDLMPETDVFSVEKEYFPTVLSHKVFGFNVPGKFLDIGTPDRYDQAGDFLSE